MREGLLDQRSDQTPLQTTIAAPPSGGDDGLNSQRAHGLGQVLSADESFGYTEEELVSSDIIGIKFGSLFDATQTMVAAMDNGCTQVQTVSWYDNENSYTSQMVRTIKYFSELA